MAKRAIVGKTYIYQAVGMDVWDARTSLKNGDLVTVTNLRGAPRANTMGHCYVNYADTQNFAGLVLVASLQPVSNKSKKNQKG